VKRTGILQLLPGASSPRQLPGGIVKGAVTVTRSIITVWLFFLLASVTDCGPRRVANGTRPKLIDLGVTVRADSTGVTVAVGVGVVDAVAVGVALGVVEGLGLGVTGGGGAIVFGTFRNPREWNERCGLGEKNERRLGEMLIGIDVWRCAPHKVE
jgi:hypothetical protein